MRSWSSPRLCQCLEPSSCQLMLTQIYYEPGGANSTELSPCPPWCQTIVVTTRLLMKLFMLGRDTNHWPSMSLAETWICKTISFCKFFFQYCFMYSWKIWILFFLYLFMAHFWFMFFLVNVWSFDVFFVYLICLCHYIYELYLKTIHTVSSNLHNLHAFWFLIWQ